MKLLIDAASPAEKLPNFWNNLHFHPTDAVEDLWGKTFLDRISADRSAQYVRLYTMFEDIVSREVLPPERPWLQQRLHRVEQGGMPGQSLRLGAGTDFPPRRTGKVPS